MSDIKVMTIFGTRPEAIKMAPLALELQRRPGIQALCCVTAQHREMLDSVLNIFKLKPDYDLNIMEPRQTLSTITSKCLLGMEGVLEEAKPDLVLVHGDTSTTFAGALAAFYHKIPVGHVEAGLRTYDTVSYTHLDVYKRQGWHNVAWILYPSFAVIIDDIYNPIFLSLFGSFFAG